MGLFHVLTYIIMKSAKPSRTCASQCCSWNHRERGRERESEREAERSGAEVGGSTYICSHCSTNIRADTADTWAL